MSVDHRISFLGGGNMAGALIAGLVRSGDRGAASIRVSEPRAERRQQLADDLGVTAVASNADACADAAVIVLAVKPPIAPSVLAEIASAVDVDRCVVVSICAGLRIASIQSALPAGARVVRAMPNTPALVGAGATAIAPGTAATPADLAVARNLFEGVGMVVEVDEAQLDAVTGLSGSGPAYMFVALEAMADAGVKVGLPRAIAQQLATQTMLGAAKLQADTGEHPAALKDQVTSPGGTTVAGLTALERAGLRAAFIDAIEAATARSRELGGTPSR